MKPFGSPERTTRLRSSYIRTIGIAVYLLLTTLVLMPLFLIGVLAFALSVSGIRLVWLGLLMGSKLATAWLNLPTDIISVLKGRKY